MINEKKVILMTKMASYEEKEGRKNRSIGSYYRSDYISKQVLKAILCATVAFLMGFGLYVLYGLEEMMEEIYQTDYLFSLAKTTLTYFAVVVIIYTAVVYLYSSYRYIKAKKSLKNFYQNLKKLGAFYGEKQK